MEVSSHAIHQHRIAGIQFCGAVFTNITHDHLDYHGTFDEYIRVKKLLFDHLPKEAFAISNIDDKRGAVMLQNTAALKCTYSLLSPATFKAKIIENNLTGLVLLMDGFETHFRLIGKFNAYNLLAVFGVAINLGEDKVNVLSHLSNLLGAKGRFETYLSAKDRVLAIVDYAHTPDALLNVLTTIQQLKVDDQQVITVVGCGGNRDADKRPLMAEVAVKYSNQVILTSDNPRNEEPMQIIQEMLAGVPISARRKVAIMEDRETAIREAVAMVQPTDVVLVAGKGHEKYQEIKGVKHPFDDLAELNEIFNQTGN
jgi:UDP-N-acetylmuramoyl-L-alanyl-D-glutamate--2,6-diaminopimelate ligase